MTTKLVTTVLTFTLLLISGCEDSVSAPADVQEHIVIYAKPSIASQLPIDVSVDGEHVGRLTSAAEFEGDFPELTAEDVLAVEVEPGEHWINFYDVPGEGFDDNIDDDFTFYPTKTLVVQENANHFVPLHP